MDFFMWMKLEASAGWMCAQRKQAHFKRLYELISCCVVPARVAREKTPAGCTARALQDGLAEQSISDASKRKRTKRDFHLRRWYPPAAPRPAWEKASCEPFQHFQSHFHGHGWATSDVQA